jgi:hypothetical protein
MGAKSQRIAAVQDSEREVVSVPEWDGERFEVRSLTLAERNRIAMATRDKKGNTEVNRYYAALVIASAFVPEDEVGAGERAFDHSDMDMLQGKNGAATDRLAKVAMRLSGLTNDDDSDGDDEEQKSSLEEAIETAGKASSSTGTSEPAS